jgi:transmembrane sensor
VVAVFPWPAKLGDSPERRLFFLYFYALKQISILVPAKNASRKWAYPVIVIVLLLVAVLTWYLRLGRLEPLAHLRDKQTTYTTYQGDNGQRKTVTLPDETQVLLNGNSRLMVPANFLKQHIVLLDGDAFFDAPHPIIVKTNIITVNVPATAAFRVRCFEQQHGATAYLYRQQVIVTKSYHSTSDNAPQTLGQNGMVLANKDIDLMEPETYQPAELQTWLQDTLTFHEEPFMNAMHKLEDWYGTEVYVNGDASAGGNVNGSFAHMSLDSVLAALQPGRKFKYKIKPERVEVNF